MRIVLLFASLSLLAGPALAAPPRPQPVEQPPVSIPPELADPAMAETLGAMVDALTRAVLDLPVVEIEAAAEGRQPSPADRGRTIRDMAGGADAERRMAEVRPAIEHGVRAFARALPAIASAMAEASERVERAMENMPRPDYPRR